MRADVKNKTFRVVNELVKVRGRMSRTKKLR